MKISHSLRASVFAIAAVLGAPALALDIGAQRPDGDSVSPVVVAEGPVAIAVVAPVLGSPATVADAGEADDKGETLKVVAAEAPAEVALARDKLARAQRAMAEKDYATARQLAEQAEADAAMGGWLLGLRAAAVLASLTVLAIVGFVVGDAWAWLPTPPSTPAMMHGLVQGACSVVALLLIVFLVRSYQNRIDDVRRLASDLAQRTAELQAREADLTGRRQLPTSVAGSTIWSAAG